MFDPPTSEPPDAEQPESEQVTAVPAGGSNCCADGFAAGINAFAGSMADIDLDVSAEELVTRLTAIENAKDAMAAAQIKLQVALDKQMRADRASAGVKADRRGEGVAKQIGLARRESPHRAAVLLGRAKTLVNQMPHTLKALETGRLNEWRAAILVRETDCLTPEQRAEVDEELAGNPERLHGLGNRQLEAEAKRIAYRLNPRSVVKRAARAEADRHVSVRPEPDTMVSVRTLLPVAQGVAVMAALTREAERLRNSGDPRSRGQMMADTVFERLTGAATADPAKLEVQLVMTDRALLQGESEPAWLTGYGIVPAQYARDLIRLPRETQPGYTHANSGDGRLSSTRPPINRAGQKAPPPGTEVGWKTAREQARQERLRTLKVGGVEDVWLRRLFTAPGSGQLLGMDSKARKFPEGIRRMIMARDAVCSGPWCDAPIRHIDHIVAWSDGGRTTLDNGQGLCERCNLAKEAEGWSAKTVNGPRQTVKATTPTGHTYTSTAPPLPGAGTAEATAADSVVPAVQVVREALVAVDAAVRRTEAGNSRPSVTAENGWAVVRVASQTLRKRAA